MRQIFNILFLFCAGQLHSQKINQIGELKLSDAKIIKVDTVLENVCGQTSKVIRFTIVAKTKVQLSCNYGDPSKNIYDSVSNKLSICYAYDSTRKIYAAVLNEIKDYVKGRQEWADQYGTGNDFTYSAFSKSFFLNGDMTVPFISTEAENSGDYNLFYFNNQVYKIILIEGNGFGSLSSFVEQNMYFVKNEQVVDLGKYIKNLDIVKQIIAKK